jgi:hypothetical protein
MKRDKSPSPRTEKNAVAVVRGKAGQVDANAGELLRAREDAVDAQGELGRGAQQ